MKKIFLIFLLLFVNSLFSAENKSSKESVVTVPTFEEIASDIISKKETRELIKKIKSAIKKGFDINQVDKYNNTILIYSAIFADPRLIEYLLCLNNIQVNVQNNKTYTAFMYVLNRFKHVGDCEQAIRTVKIFLRRYNLNLALENGDSKNALEMAHDSGQEDIAELIEHKEKERSLSQRLLNQIYTPEIGDRLIIDFIEKNKIDCSFVYFDGSNILMHAVHENRFDLARFLLNNLFEKERDLQAEDGSTALMIAIERGFGGLAMLLINCNVNIELCDNNGNTALKIAQAKNNKGICQLLEAKLKQKRDKEKEIEAQNLQELQTQRRFDCVIL